MATDEDATKKNIKIWKATPNASAGFMISERSAFLIGSKSNFVVADKTGVAIAGKSISFLVTSENVRHGGFFVKQNDFVQMIPQTVVTPVPSQNPIPPIGLISSILKDMPFFLAMLG